MKKGGIMKYVLCLIVILSFIFSVNSTQAVEKEQKRFTPKKVEIDSNYDGAVDRIEYYDESGQIEKVEIDSTGDGKINEWVTYKNGQPVKSAKDMNQDGKPDIWMEY